MKRLTIIGGGNLGTAIARGLTATSFLAPDAIHLTKRTDDGIAALREFGFRVSCDNVLAVREADLILIAVRPKQLDDVLDGISEAVDPAVHTVVSTVSDVTIESIRTRLPEETSILRAMPNVGVAVGASMTCLACEPTTPDSVRQAIADLFSALGRVEFIEEEQMTPATALCACGIAFFLRAIRAASQGGVQVGFHADEAIRLAAQTAKGAAELILASGSHPEELIDTVTTPLGITIAGLNEMEHRGFGSALIRGIVTSANRANGLYRHSPNEE